ncbi:hypothetical protein PpBr36_03488 [Pyricularia pennisetigena]|uniref:hypothetical protein n=1 Tax=Pyricularia pennisetigena TaxID=1578925 RepID=UPI00114DC885|nr:hypothetical protein PpBr36_03488 [Pyricularia pennisetigena]TLS30152.1 hypothetical protein PpBr36_03488 [Pyricularia pennisetigena]
MGQSLSYVRGNVKVPPVVGKLYCIVLTAAFEGIEQSTKRHRSGAFLYQRRDPEAALGAAATAVNGAVGQPRDQVSSRAPTITATRPGDENLPLDAVKRSHATAIGDGAAGKPTTPQKTQLRHAGAGAGSPGRGVDPSPGALRAARDAAPGGMTQALPTVPASVASRVMIEPRRFHLSRRHMAERQSSMNSRVTKSSGTSKGLGPATFVERSSKRKRTGEPKTPLTATHPAQKTPQKMPVADGQKALESDGASAEAKTEERRKLKMPSKRSAVSRPSGPRLPDSFVNRWDTDMDQLAREMNDYTLELIARDLEKIKERDEAAAPMSNSARQTPVKNNSNAPMSTASPSPRRFKPQAPAKRYAERHPEEAAAAAAAAAAAEAEAQMSMDVDDASDTEDDDGDYIIDTYVRVAADSITTEATPDQVGLLVLDNEPDIDYFYGEESDSEEEYEDDEDENAENYYTADYPDDEVASGDEFDRDAYLYQMGMSEFDGGSGSDSEDDDEDGGVPGRFKITIGRPQNLPQLY